MKKLIIIVLIIVLLGIAIAGIGIAISISNGNSLSEIFTEKYIEKSISEDSDVKELSIDIASDEVEIIPSEDGKLSILYYESEKNFFEYTYNEGKASFKSEYKFSINNLFQFSIGGRPSIKLYVPETVNIFSINLSSGSINFNYTQEIENLNVELSSGKASFDNINVNNAKISIGSGKLELSNANAENLSLKLSSGTANFSKSTINLANFEISSGTLNLNELYTKKCDCKISSGSASITLIDSDYIIEGNASSGNIELTESSGKVFSGENILYGSGEKSIKVEVSSGSVKIKLK